MRTFASLHVLSAFDLDQVQRAFDQQVTFDDTDPITSAHVQSGLVTLAPGAVSQPFGFGDVTTASMLLVIAYDHVQFQLGGVGAPLVDLIPIPASSAAAVTSTFQRQTQPASLFLRGGVSSLHLTNPSGAVPARAFVGVVGNAPAVVMST